MKKSIIALLAVVGIFALSSNSHAVPAFARQMGMDCSTCHFQQFPLLNSFGRAFKASGYTMVGKQPMVEGERLSIPEDLNTSLVVKGRYQKTNGNDETRARNHGEIQFPDEAALLIGGRAGEHVGVLLELATFGETDPDGAHAHTVDAASTSPTEATTENGDHTHTFSLFASFKMPIVYDVGGTKLSVIPYSTDTLGASFGFELLNTGAVRNVRLTEHRAEVSAQQYLGTDGPATGVAFVAYYDTGYVNYSLWKPVHGNSSASFLNYLRIAGTPQIAGWDVGIGAQLWSGTSTDETSAPDTVEKAEAWAVDAQAQGAIGSMPLGLYLTYGVAAKSTGAKNIFNEGVEDKKALAISAKLGVLPFTAVSLAYRTANNGKGSENVDDAIAVGAEYLLAQNVQLSLNHTFKWGSAYDPKPAEGDQLTTFMVFAAF